MLALAIFMAVAAFLGLAGHIESQPARITIVSLGILAPVIAAIAGSAFVLKLKIHLETLRDLIVKQQARIIALKQEAAEFRARSEIRSNQQLILLMRVQEESKNTLFQFKKIDHKLANIDHKLANKGDADKLRYVEMGVGDLQNRIKDVEFRFKGYRVHERSLSRSDLNSLAMNWAAPLGLQQTHHTLGYMANKIEAIENHCTGRLATTSQTMIARILAAQSVSTERLRILEIGVLFGVASICFYEFCSPCFKSVQMTLVDPFDGYYGPGAADIISGVPVTRKATQANLDNNAIPRADYEILQGFSHDPDVLSEASKSDYDVLLIDGDHSYEGVRKDYELYAPLVREGGIILFDDYNVNEWPDIKNFVDKLHKKNDALKLVAMGFRTAAFRVKNRIAASG